jgi:hypothetical protein
MSEWATKEEVLASSDRGRQSSAFYPHKRRMPPLMRAGEV